MVFLTLTNGELFQETVHRIHIIAMRSFVLYGISTCTTYFTYARARCVGFRRA